MKLIVLALIALAAAAALVVLIGFLLPREHVASRSALVRGTPDKVFAWLDGPQHWRPAVTRYEELGEHGGHRRWRETDSGGESIEYEVVERRPPTLLKRRIASAGLPYSGTWTLELRPDQDGTVVTITEHGEVYNPIFRFVSRFILGHTPTIDTYLRDLDRAVSGPE